MLMTATLAPLPSRAASAVAVSAIVSAALLASAAIAQTPGEWKYTISTDAASVPADMRVNFPTVSFAACRSVEDFATGRAFALQTLASSETRCQSKNVVEAESALSTQKNRNQPKKMRFDFACDEGKTLVGTADAIIESKRFVVALESRYQPPVSGVERVRQTMKAQYVGACTKTPDVDEVKVP
jgi:Protein of unknown function (DUF3617)